jgi:hypothetical protein
MKLRWICRKTEQELNERKMKTNVLEVFDCMRLFDFGIFFKTDERFVICGLKKGFSKSKQRK